MKKFFCLNPFICTRQNAYNRISPCAFGPLELQVNSNDSQQQRWNHPDLNRLRQKFLDGEQPIECKRCWDEEAAGIKSLRLRTFDYHPTAYQDLIETDAWKSGPKEVVIKTSNVCNLACRSCAGWDSSFYWPEGKFYADTYQTTDPSWPGLTNHFVQNRDKMYHPADSWTDQDLSNVEKLNFFGGEPLLDKEHPKILERLVASGRCKEVTLFYSTNCQQRPGKHLLSLWTQFKRVEVFFSVDGMEDQFEYLRWPGKWKTTQETINWFVELPALYPAVDWYFSGSQCVSLLNVASYGSTAQWLRQTLGNVYFNIVDHPNYLRMTQLPEEAKQQIADSIPDQHIRQYLFIEQSNPDALKQFVIWTKRQDTYRGQDFTKVFPETHKLIAQQWEKYNDLSDTAFWKTIDH